jgi:uncharacterized protein (TIGR03067 family)
MVCGIALVVLAGTLATAADPDDAQKIAGSWKVAACELESRLLPATAFQDLTYTLAADGTWQLDGGPGFPKAKRGRYVLNTKSTPRTIDFIPADGPHLGKTFRGIYQLEGDELKACFAFPGKDRPKTYLTQPDSGLVLEFWRRSPRK